MPTAAKPMQHLPNSFMGANIIGSVTFGVIQSSGTAMPIYPEDSNINIVDIPYSNRNIIQISGPKTVQSSYNIWVRNEDFNNLKALLRQRTTLAIAGESVRTVVMTAVSGGLRYQEGLVTCTITVTG